jgi:serine/threonine-protein kinase
MTAVSTPIANDRTALEFVELIRRSGIVPLRRIEEIKARIQSDAYSNDAQALVAWLVEKNVLTGYQCGRVLRGQADRLIIGRYVILDRIGRGAMGRVYKARHRLLGRVAALKFIAPQHLTRPNAVRRFLREMMLVGRLAHPNIIHAQDADRNGGAPYIVMEYVPGHDLERLVLSRGPLPPEQIVCYAMQVAWGLAHAHGQGIIHRDIKPSNLLLGEDGRIRILDFGLGALMDPDDADRGSFATCEGMAAGTADYMSPEQVVGRGTLDGRSDLYSLGCVMYFLLTGRVPFPGDSQVECMASRIKGRPEPLAELRPGLPSSVVQVVERLMANRPDDRYASAAAAAEALQACGECAQSPSQRESHNSECTEKTSVGTLTSEATERCEVTTASSTTIVPAPPGWWLSLLWYLSGWSQRVAFLVVSAALLTTSAALWAAFAAGFAIRGAPH